MEFAWNTQKNKLTDVKGKEIEQERKSDNLKNEDIDRRKTHLNYDLIKSNLNLYQRVKKRIDEVRENSRIQKNSVVMYSNVITVNEETYKKISENLSKESLYFWNYLFDTFKYRFIRQRLFTDDEYSFKYIKKFNNYLNEQNYKLLKEKIINFNPDFITSNLISLPKHLNKTYDTIYLSNISHYLEEYNFSLNQFRKNILELLNYLNTNGTIYIAYLYDMKETTKPLYYWDPIYQIPLLRKIFKDENFNMESFIGVQGIINDDENHKDSVLSLKK